MTDTVTIKFAKCGGCSRPVFLREIPMLAPTCVSCMDWAIQMINKLSNKRVIKRLNRRRHASS